MDLKKNTQYPSTFVFLRHGESTGNAEHRHQGQADFPLTELGLRQAHALAQEWKLQDCKFDQVFCSPLSRAKETGEILSAELGLDLIFDPIWMERNNGQLAGLRHEKALQVLPQPDNISLYDPIASTGESLWELYLRAGTAVNQLVARPSGTYLVISHGGFLNMVIHALIGLVPLPNFQGARFQIDNTGYTRVRYEPGNNNWVVLEHNRTDHLL